MSGSTQATGLVLPTHLGILGVVLAVLVGCGQGAELVQGDGLLVLEGATLIDGTGRPPVDSTVIILEGDRIRRIGSLGSFRYPDDAELVDLRGRWIVPGFIEMHAHLPAQPRQEEVLRTYLSFGITTLLNPMATAQTGLAAKAGVEDGTLMGPAIFTAGQGLNGASAFDAGDLMVRVDSEEEARAEVRRQAAAGVDFVKIYAHLPPELAGAVIEEAHGAGVPVTGHLGLASWREAVDAGIDVLVHSAIGGPTWELLPEQERDRFRSNYMPPLEGVAAFDASLFRNWRERFQPDSPLFQSLIGDIAEKGITVDPNLVVFETMIRGDREETRERLEPDYAPAAHAERWRGQRVNPTTATWDDEDFAEAQATWPVFLDMIRRFHDGGVRLTAGSDLGNPWVTPGVAWHRELELLVEAGIPPLEVLSIATRNAAWTLGVLEDVGTVEEGKFADLVVLSADPLQDVVNTRAVVSVVRRGIVYEPEELRAR